MEGWWVEGIRTTVPLEWDQSSTCVWLQFPKSSPTRSLPAATDSDPDVSVNAARCVLRIKVSVVEIRNKGLKSTTCKQSSPFPPGEGCFHLIFSLKKPGETKNPPGSKDFCGAAGNVGSGQWINLNTLPTKLTFYPDLQLYQIRILKSASHNLPYPPPVQNMKRENCKYGNEDLARPTENMK